jgi:hypothetical protein
MTQPTHPIEVYLESTAKRTFAGAIDWPGWCRSGRSEEAALQALVDYGPRYARVLAATPLGFAAPATVAGLAVVERLAGNKTTEFGAPDVAPSSDDSPIPDDELQRLQAVLRACWQALDEAMAAARGKELRKGPRGGGRDLEGIGWHVVHAEQGYVRRLAWKLPKHPEEHFAAERDRTRQAALDALAAAARGETPERGPRGGVLWKPRYFIRRVAWHVLDHVWGIEERAM